MGQIKLKKGVNLGGWMSQCDYSEERLNFKVWRQT